MRFLRPPSKALLILALVAMLTGCAGKSDQHLPPASPVLPPLADFEACNWKHSDGSPMKCSLMKDELEMTYLIAEPSAPEGWVCFYSIGQPGTLLQFYRNPVGIGRIGAYYETGSAWAPVGGAIDLTTESARQLYAWKSASASGFVRFPDSVRAGQTFEYQAIVYHSYYETNTSALQGGLLHQLWSHEGSELALIQAIDLAQRNKTYYFRPIEGLSGTLGYTFNLQGADFNVFIRLLQFLRFSEEVSALSSLASSCEP